LTELDRWLTRQAAREQRIIVLEEGLLGGRMWRYAWYRLRYFFATYLVESVAHAVMVFLLFRGLEWDNFLLVVVAFAGTALVSSFWWGALESMRAQVRDLHRTARPHRIPAAIAGWLTFAILLGALALAAAVAWTIVRALDGSLGPADVLVAAMLLRLALDLPTRCYHSGVYAMRRVYKPVGAILAPELVGLAVILLLWPFFEVWAIVASAIVVSLALTAINLYYTRRVYYFLGYAPMRDAGLASMRAALPGRAREFFAGGAAHAVMALDSLVVLALLYGAEVDSESLLVLFLVAPTIRAGFDWARVLYFDLKRLELRLFTNLRKRFERHTLLLAWLLGIVFWAVAAAITTVFYEGSVGVLYVALLAFFLARSLLARAQIQAFAEGSYGAVFGTGALLVAGLAAVGPFAESETARMTAVAVVAIVCTIALSRLSSAARARGEPGTALLTLEWLRRLGHVREPVRVGSARVASAGGPERLDARTREDRNRWRLSQLSQRAARRLAGDGAAAWVGPDRVIWFERPGDDAKITPEWLQRSSGGLIAEVVQRDCPAGEEALLAAGQARLLGHASEHLLDAVVPVDVGAARRRFEELLPDGVVYSPDEPVPPELAALPGRELRAIFFDAMTFARDLRIARRQSRFDVTALCAGGELRLIFVAEATSSRKARARWRDHVTRLNTRAAIGGVRERRAPTAILDRLAFLRA
jgi:hypothetical protein